MQNGLELGFYHFFLLIDVAEKVHKPNSLEYVANRLKRKRLHYNLYNPHAVSELTKWLFLLILWSQKNST